LAVQCRSYYSRVLGPEFLFREEFQKHGFPLKVFFMQDAKLLRTLNDPLLQKTLSFSAQYITRYII
jgi:hypothetical protein